jgi:pullulanase
MFDQTTVDLIEYYKGMIAFRKAHPVLRLTNASDVNTRVSTLTGLSDKVLGYQIDAAGVEGETAESIICVYNPNADKTTVSLPEGDWYVCVNKAEAGIYALSKVSGSVDVESVSAMILVKGNVQAKPGVDLNAAEASTNWIVVACIWAAVAALSAGGAILLLKKKN